MPSGIPLIKVRKWLSETANSLHHQGRISRKQYAIQYAATLALFISLAILTLYINGHLNEETAPHRLNTWFAALELLILFLLAYWSLLAATTRRLHDIGKSSQHCYFYCLPPFCLWLVSVSGDSSHNRYGPPT